MPDYFTTSACPICSDSIEFYSHFLCTCPPKLEVWQYMWDTYIDSLPSSFSVDTVQFVLHTLKIASSRSLTTCVDPLSAIAAALEAIWSSHWAFIFNETPFTSNTTITVLTTKVLQTRQESFILKGLPHAPLSHFSAD